MKTKPPASQADHLKPHWFVAEERRYPLAPLARALGCEIDTPAWCSRLGRIVGASRTSIHRWLRDGIPESTADSACIRAGIHPANVWDEYLETL